MEHYLAHIRRDLFGNIAAVQSVSDHCRSTAKYAAEALEPVSLSACGYLAGLVHDAGKYTADFQSYLTNQMAHRGSVNHTFAGVRLLLERYFVRGTEDFSGMASELLALAAGGHHGLFDCMDAQRKSGFQHRLTKPESSHKEAVEAFFRFCASQEQLDRHFQTAQQELTPVLEKILAMTSGDNAFFDDETAFYAGLLSRLLLSAVIEGDRRDTAEFLDGAQFPAKRSGEDLERLWAAKLTAMEEKLEQLPQRSPIDKARRTISDQCRQAAERPGGVFRLNVPPGGGKTLSGLRFALAHALQHGKQRIIFISPLLSILEQNAAVIRNYIQDDSLILEHHSNLIRTGENEQQLEEQELLSEAWESPIIISTLVQLLNTLFSGKTTAIRRFHALCSSVIVIDEVQTVPSKMLTLFSLSVNFLSAICGATVVLCSATQPCTEQLEHPLHGPIPEIVPYDPALWAAFHRTRIETVSAMSLDQIAHFAQERLCSADSLLIVCNKKGQAERLRALMKGEDFALFSLSAAMCMAHRRAVLDKLQRALMQRARKVVCVSTQVMEAGVDISFACVIRLATGMDSVVQAAGRCNRSGEAGSGILAPVYLVECLNESLSKLPDIQRGKAATQELLAEFANDPKQFDRQLDSDAAIGYYYRALYRRTPSGHHDYCIKGHPSLFSMLSLNSRYCTANQPYYFRQAFRLAGSLFHVFGEDTTDVLVPYGTGAALIRELALGNEGAEHRGADYLRSLLEAAKSYTVSLYQYQIDKLSEEHSLIPLQGGAWGLSGHYHEETGFSMEVT